MGLIGTFIDRACANRPDVMREVLNRPWGTLGDFISSGPDGEPCGCLVGTVGIVLGDTTYYSLAAAQISGLTTMEVLDAGVDVALIVVRKMDRFYLIEDDADLIVIAMLKRRIAKRLDSAKVRDAIEYITHYPEPTEELAPCL